ncbi:hypothetical protein WJX73_000833 [Symbiochloris irregularis]|uniref:Uncharacterized protein n=1 Tax=Symbiochloris irregularis TaxID=706552 RepID=A0AAW1P3C3_9CHLO
MSLVRRYSAGYSGGSAPIGLEERSDYEEEPGCRAALKTAQRRGDFLRRNSPMPASPRSSLSSPSSSPRAGPWSSRKSSGNWAPEAIAEASEEVAEEPGHANSWAGKVDSAMHNTNFEHDPAGYKSGAYTPQHGIAGPYNYRLHSMPAVVITQPGPSHASQ